MSKISQITVGANRQPFSWLPNYLINDPSVSAEVLAVALYLNGKPDNWRCRPFDIKKRFGWGDRIWYRVSRELKELGLLHENITKDGTQLWFGFDEAGLTFCRPDKSRPCKTSSLNNKEYTNKDLLKNKDLICASENASGGRSGNPRVAEKGTAGAVETVTTNKYEATTSKNLRSTKNITQQKAASDVSKKVDDKFNEQFFVLLWGLYPLKKNKEAARKALGKVFRGLTPKDRDALAKAVYEGLRAHIGEHETKQELAKQGADVWVPELPHLATWINNRRWEDGYQDPTELLSSAKKKTSSPFSGLEEFSNQIKQWEQESGQN